MNRCWNCLCLQLYQDIEKVRAETLIVKVFSKVLCDLDSLVLWELGGTGNVQEQSAQLGERRLLVSATWTSVIVTAALGSATVITAVMVVVVICATLLVQWKCQIHKHVHRIGRTS